MWLRNYSFFYLVLLNLGVFIILTIYIHFYLLNVNSNRDFEPAYLHLKDLENVKLSLRNELQHLETKRYNYLSELRIIKRKIRLSNQSLLKLKTKFDLMETKLENRITQLAELDTKAMQNLNIASDFEFLAQEHIPSQVKIDPNSIESCFDLKRCFVNSDPKFFVSDKSLVRLNFELIQQSFKLTNNVNQACFSIFFVSKKSNLAELKNTLIENNLKKNLIFINDYSHDHKTISREYLITLFNDTNIEKILKCSIFVSLIPKNLLNLNFGLIGSNYLIECDLTSKRNFLFINKYNLVNSKSIFFFEIYKNFYKSHLSQVLEPGLILKSDFVIFLPNEENRVEIVIDLIEALNSATIPVLFDLEFELPLSNLIAWDEIVIRLSFGEIKKLPIILQTLKKHELVQRRIKARKVYKSYFKSITDQFKTILAAVGHKIGLVPSPISDVKPFEYLFYSSRSKFNSNQSFDGEYLGQIGQPKQDSIFYQNNYSEFLYKKWNFMHYPFNIFPSDPFFLNYLSEFSTKGQAETQGGGDGKFFHSHLSGNYDKLEQFTIVILAFNREKLLVNYIENYFRTIAYLNSILVVWNSVNTEPKWNLWQNVSYFIQNKRLKILKMNKNSLNNRFLPFDAIKTEAVLGLDDDVFLRPDEIVFAFRVWRENRDRIVGFPARYHSFNTTSNQFMYKSYLSCEYSMVLTGAAFYHKFYNYYYSYINDEKFKQKVDELMNCEDIAFNMMVAHLTRKAPLKVTTKYSFYCADCENLSNDSPISLRGDHYPKRSECIDYFIKIYGYNPLLYSQFRADSVLYRTKLNRKEQRCFNLI